MSSQLTSLVQTFDGQNYGLWSKAMRAYLQSQGLWAHIAGSITAPIAPPLLREPPVLPETATDRQREAHDHADDLYQKALEKYPELKKAFDAENNLWNRMNDMALGTIVLRLSPAIQQQAAQSHFAELVWTQLDTLYGTPTIPQVYHDFKEVISIRFNPTQHPAAALNKMAAAFQ